MVNKRQKAQLEKKLLKGLENHKEQVEKALKVQKEYYKDCNTRGMSVIDILTKIMGDKTLIFEIEQWSEEKENNTYDYSAIIVNNDGEVVYEECDGELPLPRILGIYNDFDLTQTF